ncbi:MAG: uncharacterized protein KVP18_004917 [Porospora cf. gigantea A]|uniref:uncharacterized protein n=1 Tax=Porospora cf. gigantea A TaxID=2853593 RepID=UPI003559ACEE|nr:MAG: hypothetical protein KVP18_004917 [Porospora cf. gigantea A]
MPPMFRYPTLFPSRCVPILGALLVGVVVGSQLDYVRGAIWRWRNRIPEDAPDHCPFGTETAGVASACEGCPNQAVCAAGAPTVDPAVEEVKKCLAQVKHKIVVLSGKGGVGKSTVSTQLAWHLSSMGLQVGLLDVDICGPSLPLMCGVVGSEVHRSGSGYSPVYVNENLCVMSIGFLLPEADAAVIWRGPKKNGMIRQFLSDVYWGALDVLVVDTPPGTSDEHLSVLSYLTDVDGAIVVTTPQEAALADVRKEINFCRSTGLRVLGVVENMAHSVFDAGKQSVHHMCSHMDVELLGSLSLDGDFVAAGDEGRRIRSAESVAEMAQVVQKVTKLLAVEHEIECER